MSQRTSKWLARGLCILCLALTIIGFIFEAMNRAAGRGAFIFPNGVIMAVCFPIVGMIIASHQPRNAVGWLFIVIGLSEAVPLFTIPFAIYSLAVNPGVILGGELISWLAYWAFFPGVALIPFALSLFPDGRLLSRRWQWLTWVTVIGIAIGTISLAWTSWPYRGPAIVPYLQSEDSIPGSLLTPFNLSGTLLLLISTVGSIVAIALRFYRSHGVERLQMKWCIYAIAVVVALQPLVLFVSVTEEVPGTTLLSQILLVLQSLGFIGIAVAIGIAILRYRLYDIELIINRTLVYGAITIILTTIWVTTTTLIQQIASQIAGTEFATTATVFSTVVVVSLFQPLRNALESWINERFYPENLDIMRDFAELSVGSLELLEMTELIVHRISSLMRSDCAVIFLNQGNDSFEPTAQWQASGEKLNAICLPNQMHDRWGRARSVQQSEPQPFRLLVPLYIPRLRREEVIGILALGPRPGGQGYSWDDRRGLTNFGKQVGLKLLAIQLAHKKEQRAATAKVK